MISLLFSYPDHPVYPVKKRKFLYPQVTDIPFVFSVFRVFVIILFFFVCCTIRRITAQVENIRIGLVAIY